MLARDGEKRLARVRLHIRRIDDRQTSAPEALPENTTQNLECGFGCGLIVRVVTD